MAYTPRLGYDFSTPILAIGDGASMPVAFPWPRPHEAWEFYNPSSTDCTITTGTRWVQFTSNVDETEFALPVTSGTIFFPVISTALGKSLKCTVTTGFVNGASGSYVTAFVNQNLPLRGGGFETVSAEMSFYFESLSGPLGGDQTSADIYLRYAVSVGVVLQTNSGGWARFTFEAV